jgi:hypothetical protein
MAALSHAFEDGLEKLDFAIDRQQAKFGRRLCRRHGG